MRGRRPAAHDQIARRTAEALNHSQENGGEKAEGNYCHDGGHRGREFHRKLLPDRRAFHTVGRGPSLKTSLFLHCTTSFRCGASQITPPTSSGSTLQARFLFRGRETVSNGLGGDGKRRNCRAPNAQFGRCRNTIQALLWARPVAEA